MTSEEKKSIKLNLQKLNTSEIQNIIKDLITENTNPEMIELLEEELEVRSAIQKFKDAKFRKDRTY